MEDGSYTEGIRIRCPLRVLADDIRFQKGARWRGDRRGIVRVKVPDGASVICAVFASAKVVLPIRII